MLKGRQLGDRLAHVDLFPPQLPAGRFFAHRSTLSAPAACICLYRSLNSSRPRLMRIFAAERPTPSAWATSSYESPSISQRTRGILSVLDMESSTRLVSCRSLIVSAIRSAVD